VWLIFGVARMKAHLLACWCGGIISCGSSCRCCHRVCNVARSKFVGTLLSCAREPLRFAPKTLAGRRLQAAEVKHV
jgi:hypothetical protein